jgi:NtrC-family two-component system sensor histidine kinase KinB
MLRTRLMSGLVCLLIILLAMGLYSINQCSELGKRIQRITSESDRVGQNLRNMKQSGGAMTGALLALVTGDEEKSRSEFNTASANFKRALEAEKSRPDKSDEEEKLIDQLAAGYAVYAPRALKFLQAPEQPSAGWRADAKDLGEETTRILGIVDEIGVAHDKTRSVTGKSSENDIVNTIGILRFMMLIALIATVMAYMGLSRGLINPLRSLTASIKRVGEGNLDQTVPVISKDELGVLAISFNQMASQLRQYQANTSVELLRLNLTIRATLASFPDPIFVLNSAGAVEFRNPAADQLAMKLLFSGVTRLPSQVDQKVEEVLASGTDYLPTLFKDALKFHLDGQDRYFLPRVVLLRDEKRETFGVAVILENVTRMLLLDDVKSNLIATVSHELKTPLTSVRMALYLLFERTVGSLNDKQSDLVAAAREDADRLLKTLNDLLDLAKLEQGPSQLKLKPVSPAKLADSAAHSMRELAHASRITLTTEVAPNLPEIQIDEQRLAYVFTNLITNALKYSPPNSKVKVRAQLGMTRASKPSVRFSVKDDGEGISPEHQEHIFERFYRVPGTQKNGAGLGLSIAREIVVAHQGEIGVLSQPGKGSEFFFVVPLILEASSV